MAYEVLKKGCFSGDPKTGEPKELKVGQVYEGDLPKAFGSKARAVDKENLKAEKTGIPTLTEAQ